MSASSVVVSLPDRSTAEQVQPIAPNGLTGNEAAVRLKKDGPNALNRRGIRPGEQK
ncbi:MAG: cation-transporting P-type ATPase [Terracidiphilus sp.]